MRSSIFIAVTCKSVLLEPLPIYTRQKIALCLETTEAAKLESGQLGGSGPPGRGSQLGDHAFPRLSYGVTRANQQSSCEN